MMTYTKPLPRIDNILWLAKLARPFPATARQIKNIAKLWGFSSSTTDFLELFPEDEEFDSRDDFLNRCDDLEVLIHEERQMPEEFLRSPQD